MTSGTDPADAPADERLICGARVEDVLDQVSGGHGRSYTDHQASCPHCQAALAEYDRLWAPVRDLAATTVRAPDSILEAAMRRMRGTDTAYGSLSTPTGATRIAARVVVVTARETAQDIAGVRVALSKIVGSGAPAGWGEVTETTAAHDDGPRVVAGVAGRSTAIELTLAADYGVDLRELGDRIRARVADRVRELTGLDTVVVSVRIDDVLT